ncbi:MAG: hypothetical protein LBC59_05185 [Chitinispirillales bacterium]|jgi:hypothetical protein|nr:hypothetical protein [Chitinispirillales bacterium]
MDINTREKLFYEALGAVPEVPAGVLEKVNMSVRRSGVKRRATLAACLLLAFIIPASLVVFKMNNKTAAYADDHGSMEELLYAFEFLNGGGDDDAYPLLDEIQADDSAAAVGAAKQQQSSEPSGGQLTKKSSEKGLSNEK